MNNKRHTVVDCAESLRNAYPCNNVDYLSYDFNVMDLALSWRLLKKQNQKAANDIRLENASWRTWAKQKNNLKTISPKTLNWLKDNDVTWLYGPLHIVIENMESNYTKPRVATAEEKLGLITSSQAHIGKDTCHFFDRQNPTEDQNNQAYVAENFGQAKSDFEFHTPSHHHSEKTLKPALKKVKTADLLKKSMGDLHFHDVLTKEDKAPQINHHSKEFLPHIVSSPRQPRLRFNSHVEQYMVVAPFDKDFPKKKTRFRFSTYQHIPEDEYDETSDESDEFSYSDKEEDNELMKRRTSNPVSVKKIESALLKKSERSVRDSICSSLASDEDDSILVSLSSNTQPNHQKTYSPLFHPPKYDNQIHGLEIQPEQCSSTSENLKQEYYGHLPNNPTNSNSCLQSIEYDIVGPTQHIPVQALSYKNLSYLNTKVESPPVFSQKNNITATIKNRAPVINDPTPPGVKSKIKRRLSDLKLLDNRKRLQKQNKSNNSNTPTDKEKSLYRHENSSIFGSIANWASAHIRSHGGRIAIASPK